MSSVNSAQLPNLQAFRTAAAAGIDGYVKLGGANGVKSTGGGFFQKLIGKPSGTECRRVREALFSAMSASTGDNELLRLTIENVRNELGLGPASDPKIGNKPLSQRELKMILDNFDGAKAGTEAVMKKSTYGNVMKDFRPELRKVYAEQYAYGAGECEAFKEKINKCFAANVGQLTKEAAELALDEFKDWTNLIPGRLTATDLSKECRDDLLAFEDQIRQRVENLRSELMAGTKSPCEVLEKLIDVFAAQNDKLAEVKADLVNNVHPLQAQTVMSHFKKGVTLSDDFNRFLKICGDQLDTWKIKDDIQKSFGPSLDKLPITDENKAIFCRGIENILGNGTTKEKVAALDEIKKGCDSQFWTNLSDGIKAFNKNRSQYAKQISSHLETTLPRGIAKAMADQFCEQMLKYCIYRAPFDPKNLLLPDYAKQCVKLLADMDASLVQTLCPMFNMNQNTGINSYLKNKIVSDFTRFHNENAETHYSTLNKVSHVSSREYQGAGTVLFDGKITEKNTSTIEVPADLSSQGTYKHNFYKFMFDKFDDNHCGVSQLLTYCLSKFYGIHGVSQDLFAIEGSSEYNVLRNGQEMPFVASTAMKSMALSWNTTDMSTYEITTDRKNGEFVIMANVNLSPTLLDLPGGNHVCRDDAPFRHGLLKNTAQVRIRIKNTDDETLRKKNKIHPDFEVEILSQKIADRNGKELMSNVSKVGQ